MAIDNLCEFLDWDSEFFGRRMGRARVNKLDSESTDAILQWCHQHKIECLYFLADANDRQTVRLAEENKFNLVDIRVTLEKQLERKSIEETFPCVTLCMPEDIPTLRAIAGVCYSDSRFYHDGNFASHLCDALYEVWIEKSCQGYANAVWVARLNGQPMGYISCHLLDKNNGQIGLVGIAPGSQGKGLGNNLLKKVLWWFSEQNVTHVSVATQGRNIKAQRFYQKCGFLTRSVQLWYHHWFDYQT